MKRTKNRTVQTRASVKAAREHEKFEKLINKYNFDYKDLDRLTTKHSYFQSYEFSVHQEDKLNILAPRLWPKSMTVREFIEI